MEQFPIIPTTDEEYMHLIGKNPRHFVLTTGKGKDSPSRIHYGNCMHVCDPSSLKDGGTYVTKGKVKVISPKIEDLKQYVRSHKELPAIIQHCRTCNASNEIMVREA